MPVTNDRFELKFGPQFGQVRADAKIRGRTCEFLADHRVGGNDSDFVSSVCEEPGGAGATPVTAFVEHNYRIAEFGLIAQYFFAGKHLAVFQTG